MFKAEGGAISSMAERSLDVRKVIGSSPISPTVVNKSTYLSSGCLAGALLPA